MSIKMALEFMQQVRTDQALRGQLQELGYAPTLEEIVNVAAQAGYEFTSEELRHAFKHDWGMRWMFYGAGAHDEQALAAPELEDDR
ncbi:MAG TPA: Nif11-like leader peptide family natural product precursor [Anaerolineae bacterium]|nr:Nif11-like leader peptide family natural product precursor [Anaerolineae bacterium]